MAGASVVSHNEVTARPAIDAALADLKQTRRRWAGLGATAKVELLRRLLRDCHAVAEQWAMASADAKGVDRHSAAGGEEWAFAFLLKAVAVLKRSLEDIVRSGRPHIPGAIKPCGDGQVSVRVFPQTGYDRIFFPGLTAEIWTEPGVGEATVTAEQASLYRLPQGEGKTVLVLGAGNVSILGPCDILDKLFCEGAVVVYKTHPVTDYLTPLLERGFAALIGGGFLRIVRTGAEEGSYLAGHELVDELHLTGSDRTYNAIVFGAGDDGARRRASGERLVTKRFTCELGSVSPVIVVPGPWRRSHLAYQAQHLAAMQVFNAGFNCHSARVIIQHAGWALRAELLDAVRSALAHTPTRPAYYPGAHAIHRRFMDAHPEAEWIGEAHGSNLPWTLIADIDSAQRDDLCFTTEAFCSLFAETALAADDVPTFIERAVQLANETIWGSLTSTILVHPESLKDHRVAAALERAVRDLRYGTVGVNVWGALNYITMTGSWGAFPGHTPADIRSGQGAGHNYLMIPRPQKTVCRAPFRQWPKPLVFPSHRTLPEIGRLLADFEAAPSPLQLPRMMLAAAKA